MGRFGEFGYDLWLPLLGACVWGIRALWIKAKVALSGHKEP